MNKVSIKWLCSLAFSISTVMVFQLSSSNVVAADSLNIHQYLSLLTEHDPELKQLRLSQEQVKFFVDQERSESALNLSVETEYGYGDDDVDSERLDAALEKQFLETGTRVALSHQTSENTDRDEQINELRVEQDLLKNAFGKQQKNRISVLRQEASLAELENMERYEAYLSDRLVQFLELARAQSKFSYMQHMLSDTRSLHAYVTEKLKHGAAYQSDERRVKVQVLELQQALIDQEHLLKQLRSDLFSYLKLPSGEAESLPISPPKTIKDISRNELKEVDVTGLRKYQITKYYHGIGLSSYELSKQEQKAALSIFGAYRQDDSQRFTTTVDRSESSVGLNFSMPIASKKLKARKMTQALESEKLEIGLGQQQKLLLLEQAELLSQLTLIKSKMKLAEQKRGLSEAILRDDRKRYERGKINIDQVLEAANKTYDHQIEAGELLITYNQHYLRYLDFSDQLLGIGK